MGFVLLIGLVVMSRNVTGAPGETITTPLNPTEIPVEIEVETGIGSLKQAPLWKELVQMLEDPYLAPVNGTSLAPSSVVRRPGFGVAMPPLNVWPLGYNFLTAQPLRIRTNDAEISWDQPGPLFHTGEVVDVSTDPYTPNVPVEQRTIKGYLVACPDPGYFGNNGPMNGPNSRRPACEVYDAPDGALVVSRRPPQGGNPLPQSGTLPAHGTVVAVPAVVGGVLYQGEIVGGELELEPVIELEMPVNEEHFIKNRDMAEVLGKTLFWEMQIGSDGVQACGTCHFHAGVDNRTRNQLNPNTLGGDLDLEVQSVAGSPTSNVEVIASDFPFHKRINPDIEGDGLLDPVV